MVSFTIALGISAGALGFGLFAIGKLIGIHDSRVLVVGGILTVLAAIGLVGRSLPGVGFEVPMHWIRLGPVLYPGAFGLALGAAIVTVVASPGIYLILLWGLVAPGAFGVALTFVAFAVGRALPSAVIGIRSFTTTQHYTIAIGAYHRVVPMLSVVEVGVVSTAIVMLVRIP